MPVGFGDRVDAEQAVLAALLDRLRAARDQAVPVDAAVDHDMRDMERNLLPLKRDGLISIGQGQEDLRSKEVSLTAAGAEKQRAGLRHWQAAQAGFEETFGPKRSAELRALLGAVVQTELA